MDVFQAETMLQRLHLKHVQQAVCVLESVVLRSFGPEGGQVLFTRDTGQAVLSRSGTCILRSLQLEHPLARMVVDCVWKHSTATGDGSKTFILLLASLLRLIHASASTEPSASHSYNSSEAAQTASARRSADKLLTFALKDLNNLIDTEVAPYGCCVSWHHFTLKSSAGTNVCVQKLLASFFQTRLSHVHCDFISELTCQLLKHFDFMNSFVLQFLNDSFPALHTSVSGFSVSSSRLIEGQVIHRDFATPCPPNKPVKAVVFTAHLPPKLLSAEDVLQVGCSGEGAVEERSIVQFGALMERSLEGIVSTLQALGVSVLLSSVKQSAVLLAAAARAGMCVVECVSEDELYVFARLSGTTPVSDWRKIQEQHVASLAFCRPIQLGAHRYVHVDFHVSEEGMKPCSLVLCAPGEGQAEQYRQAFQDAIRMLRTTWTYKYDTVNGASERTQKSHQCTSSQTNTVTQNAVCGSWNHLPQYVLEPGCLIPAGGTFEFLLSNALLKQRHNCSLGNYRKTDVDVTQLLARALLSIPRQIHAHSQRKYVETRARVENLVSTHSQSSLLLPEEQHSFRFVQKEGNRKPSLSCCRTGELSIDCMWDFGLESISCKSQLLLAVLQCLTSLLRVDAVLHAHTHLHTQSGRLGQSSWDDTEEED